jgi:hypothetical protein
VGEFVGVGVGELKGVGVVEGLTVLGLIRVPLFQRSLVPDFIQVYFLLFAVITAPFVGHLLPAITSAPTALWMENNKERMDKGNRLTKILERTI